MRAPARGAIGVPRADGRRSVKPNRVDAKVRAALNLEALLGLLETLVASDPEARALVADESLVMQFEVRGGPAVHLDIDRGTIRHGLGPHPRPAIRLEYPSFESLNGAFNGRPVIPKVRKGMFKVAFLATRFPKLTGRLAACMQGTAGQGNTDQDLRTRLMLRALVSAAPVLARHDPSVVQAVTAVPAGRMSIRLEPSGPWASLEKTREGSVVHAFEPSTGPGASADVLVTFDGTDVARDLVEARVGFAEALRRPDVMVEGDETLASGFAVVLTRFEQLMAQT